MLIDWFTVGAQLVNFLILVVLLKYVLYDRIIAAMDKREQTIRSRIEEAEEKKREAEHGADTYHDKVSEFEKNRDQMLSQAKEQADSERKERTKQARSEVDQLQKKWIERIQQQQDSFLHDLKQRVGKQVVSISRRVLKDLAHADLEPQVVAVFIDRVQKMDKEKQEAIAESLSKDDHKVTVYSRWDMSSHEKQRITKTLRDCITQSLEVDYQTSPEVILGIEVRTPASKIAWNINDYLQSLQSHMARELAEEIGSTSNQQGALQKDETGGKDKEKDKEKKQDENGNDAH